MIKYTVHDIAQRGTSYCYRSKIREFAVGFISRTQGRYVETAYRISVRKSNVK